MLEHQKVVITTITSTIYKVKPYEGIELDEKNIREMRAIYLSMSKSEPFAILLDASNVFTVTDAARRLLASKEYTDKRLPLPL